MGERNVLRDILFGLMLAAIIVLLFIIVRQNEHDVAKRMEGLGDTMKQQDVTVRGVRDAVQEQSGVLREILTELQRNDRAFVAPANETGGTKNSAATRPAPGIKKDERAAWEKRYADPKAEPGGTLYRIVASDPGTLNPLIENDKTVSVMHQYISESLATRDFKNPDRWLPELATHWEESQSSWAILKSDAPKDLAEKLTANLNPEAKAWISASTEPDGRLRLDLKNLGDRYLQVVEKAIGLNHFVPVQWVEAKFLSDAGNKDLPDQAKVVERFIERSKARKDVKLAGPQAWSTDSGLLFRVPGERAAAEAEVKEFLGQEEQSGAKGPAWAVNKTETLVFEDKLYFTFHLRPNVRWHDGEPLTVKDYLFSFKALKDPGVNCQPSRNYYQDCENLEAPDASSLRFTWRKLFAGAFSASSGLTLLPEHIYRYETANQLNTHARNNEAFGTGPYRFKEWFPKQRIVLERNENYWGLKPNYEKIFFRVVSESVKVLQFLKDKKLDIGALTPTQWVNDTNKPPFNEPHGLTACKQYALYYSYIGWNARLPELSDKRVRRALTQSINRPNILHELLFDLGAVVSGTFYHKSPYTDPNIKPWPYDPEAAGKLFAEAGWKDSDGDGFLDKDGKKLEVKIRFPAASETGKKILIAVQSDLKKAGVACELDPIEWSVFLTKIKKREFGAISLGWSLGWDPDPYQLWHSSQAAGEGSNHCSFINKEADEIIERLRKTLDLQERIKLCRRFHAILHEEQPYTFMFNSMALFCHNADLKNNYLPLEPGEERELYLPLIDDHGFTRFWYTPRVYQRTEE